MLCRRGIILLVAWCAGAGVGAGAGLTAAAAEPRPYDIVRQCSGSYLSQRDPLGFGLRIYGLAQSRQALGLGAPEVFLAWCRGNTQDWIADADASIPCHGNPLLSRMSSYPAAGGFGKLAFGLVDFDDSARLPLQIELLHGVVMLRLVAEQNRIELSDQNIGEMIATMTEPYRAAARSTQSTTALLADDPWVMKTLSGEAGYSSIIDRYTSGARFRGTIEAAGGRTQEILRPAGDAQADAAAILADAIANAPLFAQQLRYRRADDVRGGIRDVAQRTRLADSPSPGAKEYLVLMLRPLNDVDHDVILSIRQQFPSAAEGVQLAPREERAAAERAATNARPMTDPNAYLCAWGRGVGGGAGGVRESFQVTLLDPWSRALDVKAIATVDDLLHAAHIWGTTVGATHRQANDDQVIAKRLTPELAAALKMRSGEYLKYLESAFPRLTADPLTINDIQTVKSAISAAEIPAQ